MEEQIEAQPLVRKRPRLRSPELRPRLGRRLPPIVLVTAIVVVSAFLWIVEPVRGFSRPAAFALVAAWLLLFLSAQMAQRFGFFADLEFADAAALGEGGRLREAERAYDRSIRRLRRSRRKTSFELLRLYLLRRCYALMELGRLAEALTVADELVAACEGRDDVGSVNFAGVARTARADILMGLGDPRGRQAFEDVFAGYADHADPTVRQVAAFAINKLGVWLDRSGDYDGAIASYDLAIYRFANEPDPDIRSAVAVSILNRGRAFRSTGRALEAVSDHERVINTYANDVNAFSTVTWAKTELGLSLIALGRFSEAVAKFDEFVAVTENEPGSASNLLLAQALCGKGLALTQLGRPKEALEAYEAVIARCAQEEAPAAVSLAREKIKLLRQALGEV